MSATLPTARRRLALLALVLVASGATAGCLTEDLNSDRAARMEAEAGNAQTLQPLGRTVVPLTVQVFDQQFSVMPGQTVTWAVVSGGGTVASPSTVTNQDGLASTHYTAGSTPGGVEVSATLDGLGTIVFTLTVASASGPS